MHPQQGPSPVDNKYVSNEKNNAYTLIHWGAQSSLIEYCFDIQAKESIRNTESISVNEDIPKITKARLDEMVILDCIVERKTVADLASSISDGRYREQKQRLMTCGVRSKSYIIEVL